MKNFTLFRTSYILFFLIALLHNSQLYSQTILGTYDFETGWEGWISGGTNATRVNNSPYVYSLSHSIKLVDNGTTATMTSPSYELALYDKVDLKFFFTKQGFQLNKGFTVEYSSDPYNTTWKTVATFSAGNNDETNFGDFLKEVNSIVAYSKTVTLLKTDNNFPTTPSAKFRIKTLGDTLNGKVFIDLVSITATTFIAPSFGPGGINNTLDLWLRSDKLDGALVGVNNTNVNVWKDLGKGNDAKTIIAGQEPVYKNNITDNFNFNPTIDFQNNHDTTSRDITYLENRDVLHATSGFNSNEVFIVLKPHPTIVSSMKPMHAFTGKEPETTTHDNDVTGFGFGNYSERYNGEYLMYAVGKDQNTNGNPNYSRIDNTGSTSYHSQLGIINIRHNSGNTGSEIYYNANQVGTNTTGLSHFKAVNNSKYWIGRSQQFGGSFNGRIAEIITYTSRKTDGPQERRRIESYLALKYGITLGQNGASVNYVNSAGQTVWDINENTGFNHDIAGIFEDDNATHKQKQSRSSNPGSPVTIGLTNIALTNDANTNNFNTDNSYLIWGNNGEDLSVSNTPISIDLGLTNVTTITNVVKRKWKIKETGGDVPTVKISVLQSHLSSLPTLVGNDAYVMVIADDALLTANVKTLFLKASTFNNNPTFETSFNFNSAKYFTFGVAHETVAPRHLEFNGIDNYATFGTTLNLPGNYTISAWVRSTGSNSENENKTIIAKSNTTEGYILALQNDNTIKFSVGAINPLGITGKAAFHSLVSNTAITPSIWHHVALTYNGTDATIYIDGVIDSTAPIIEPPTTNAEFTIGAVYKNNVIIEDYFMGDIDEVKLFNVVNTPEQIRYMMNQEIEKNLSHINGTIIPNTIFKNDLASMQWSSILAYFSMNTFIGTNLNDVSGNKNRGALTSSNQFTVQIQTAPLPYISINDGNWNVNNVWRFGAKQSIPGTISIIDSTQTIDWNIVNTNTILTMDNANLPEATQGNRSLLALIVESNKIIISGNTETYSGNGLTVTHYLKLNGNLDLVGESQLIQPLNSSLDSVSSGVLSRDQQGTQDLFTYNYWSSPVGTSNATTNNNSYAVPNVLFDGSTVNSPIAINFLISGYDGSFGSPIGIADYWIWKYSKLNTNYYNWQHIRSTGSLNTAEGFTMKGVNNTNGNTSLKQNYVFKGKPNNGAIALPISSDNDYLVGNPYPSALDAHQFISDNSPEIAGSNSGINGTLYFWEHWGGGSHTATQFQGDFATFNLSGAAPAATWSNTTSQLLDSLKKLPGRYIPVSQGFFVMGESLGSIIFNNGQRIFKKEGNENSVFLKSETLHKKAIENTQDSRLKIRLGFNSVNTIHRQLLLTRDANATLSKDYGYDGAVKKIQIDDLFWMINNEKFTIQGTNNINETTVLPLGIKTNTNGINTITIDALENVPSTLEIFILDNVTQLYHNIKNEDFSIHLPAGDHLNRFELRFQQDTTLTTDSSIVTDNLEYYFTNNNTSIVINNPKLKTIKSVEMFNTVGQSVIKFNAFDSIKTQEIMSFKTSNISTGAYILKIKTDITEVSKKVLVK